MSGAQMRSFCMHLHRICAKTRTLLQLLTNKGADLCEPLARKGQLLEPMLEAIFLILSLASDEV